MHDTDPTTVVAFEAGAAIAKELRVPGIDMLLRSGAIVTLDLSVPPGFINGVFRLRINIHAAQKE